MSIISNVDSKGFFQELIRVPLEISNLDSLLKEGKTVVLDNSKFSELFSYCLGIKFNIKDYPKKKEYRIKLLCNWCSSEEISRLWMKMYNYGTIKLVQNDPEFYVIINGTTEKHDKKKSIVFRMEPDMIKNKNLWGEWSDPDDKEYLKVFRHEKGDYNNIEWHISKTYEELIKKEINKTETISTILSEKYTDIGHIKRIDFVKFLEKKGLCIDVFGSNKWNYKNYKGSLPYHTKDNGLLPYKYTFNVENKNRNNYFTEKLIDGILCECLVFYSGCDNVHEYIDNRAFVKLDLSNYEKDYETIKKAIEEDWHTQRLPYIRKEKEKILNVLQFFPRLERFLEL